MDASLHDHRCPWREIAEAAERRLGEMAAQQTLILEQQEIIRRQAAIMEALEARLGEKDAADAEHAARIAALEAEVARLERNIVGKKSEKIPAPEKEPEEPSDEELRRRREAAEKKRRENALARNAALETQDVEHPIPDADKPCPTCGDTEHDELPPETTTRIDYVPGRFVKRRHKRQKIVRKCACPGTSIVVAPAPAAPIAGGLYGAGFIAFLVVEKCADTMPIYRLEKRFARQGIPIARSTMNDLVLAAAERLGALFRRLVSRMAQVEIVLADETSMRLQDREKRGFMWVFHGHDDKSGGELVSYVFALDRSGTTPASVLGASEGTLLVDGYTGYNVVTDPTKRDRAGCWCHARRKCFDALGSAPDEAMHAMMLMRPLFRVEHEASVRGIVGTAEHLALRDERSRPAVDAIFEWVTDTRPKVLPKSPIGAALKYLENQRERLELFLTDARIPLHNNASESRLRVIALARKTYLFFGHPRAGKLFAGLYSLVGSCIANDVEPTAYLTDVLVRIQGATTDAELDALLPDRWTPPS